MKYKWLNKNDNNREVIIFFNGWGMDDCVIKHLDSENYNILMFYDYNDLVFDFKSFDFDLYAKRYLIAWSMGVMVATNFDIKYDKIILSSDDKIIPTKNQIAFWGIKPNIDSGHAPFNHFKKWSELL